MHLLGSFEQAVLLAVVRPRANAYGRAILNDIREKLDASVTSGAVYATLGRLETKGLLSSRTTGNGRRYFSVLANGMRALEKRRKRPTAFGTVSSDAVRGMNRAIHHREIASHWKRVESPSRARSAHAP